MSGRIVPRGLGDLARWYRRAQDPRVLEAILVTIEHWDAIEQHCNCDAGPWPDHEERCGTRRPKGAI